MPTVSNCPCCSCIVAIPQGLEATALVRCPLCGATYPLNETIDMPPPPELIPVTTSVEAIPDPIADGGLSKPIVELNTEESSATDDQPSSEIELEPGKTPEPVVSVPPSIGPSFPFEFSSLAIGEEPSENDLASEDTGEVEEIHFDTGVFTTFSRQPGKTDTEPSDQVEPPSLPRRVQRAPKSVYRIFFETILGGVAGVSIAYIALAWMMGSRFDWPRPPKVLQPVLRFVLPSGFWPEKEQQKINKEEGGRRKAESITKPDS
jgi:hypothetical protein